MIARAEGIAVGALTPDSTVPAEALAPDATGDVASFASVMRGVTGSAKNRSGGAARTAKAKPVDLRKAQALNNATRHEQGSEPGEPATATKLTALTEASQSEVEESRDDNGDAVEGAAVQSGNARARSDLAASDSSSVANANFFVPPLFSAQPAATVREAETNIDSIDETVAEAAAEAGRPASVEPKPDSWELAGSDSARDMKMSSAQLPGRGLTKMERLAPVADEASLEKSKTLATPANEANQQISTPPVAATLPTTLLPANSELKAADQVTQALSTGSVAPSMKLDSSPNVRPPEPQLDGMFVAKQENMMKTAGNREDSSQRGEQKLPPGEDSVPKLEAASRLKTKSLKAAMDFDVEPAMEAQVNWPPLVGNGATERLSPVSEARGAGLLPIHSDPVAAQISRQAIALKHFNAESMAVVLKPDPATAVFLHLRLNHGSVEVQARFERGDYAALNAGWGQVQQALSAQGIRLGPLQEPTSNHSTHTPPPSFASLNDESQKKQTPKNFVVDASWENASPRRSAKTSLRRAAPPAPARSKHWESWA